MLGLVLLIFNTIYYAEKNKVKGAKKNAEIESGYIPVAAKGKKKSIWPLVIILDLILIIMVLGFYFLDWSIQFKYF